MGDTRQDGPDSIGNGIKMRNNSVSFLEER